MFVWKNYFLEGLFVLGDLPEGCSVQLFVEELSVSGVVCLKHSVSTFCRDIVKSFNSQLFGINVGSWVRFQPWV